MPSPLVIGRSAKAKVGAKCSAGCDLTGHEIELLDGAGRVIVRSRLGGEVLSGTSGLHWTEMEFVAPSAVGAHTCTATLVHGEARLEFTFIIVPPPECSVTIQILEQRTNTPLPDVDVRFGIYRASSNEQGRANVELPTGNYTVNVWKMGYQLFSTDIIVTGNQTVDVALVEELEPAQPYWM